MRRCTFLLAVAQLGCGSVDVKENSDGPSLDGPSSDGVGADTSSADAAPSLDHQRMLISSYVTGRAEVWSTRLDGSDRIQITDQLDPGGAYFGTASADGQTIAASYGNDIWLVRGTGAVPRQLTTNAASDYRPALSADGTQVVFVSDRDAQRNLYIVDVATGESGGVMRLTNTSDTTTFPQWSPDGTKVVYANDTDQDVWAIDVAVGAASAVDLTLHAGMDTTPSYSADGSKIVFSSDRDGLFELYTMDADGGNPTRVTMQTSASNLDEYHPSFDLSGQWIIYYAAATVRALYATSLDGLTTNRLSPEGITYDEEKTSSRATYAP